MADSTTSESASTSNNIIDKTEELPSSTQSSNGNNLNNNTSKEFSSQSGSKEFTEDNDNDCLKGNMKVVASHYNKLQQCNAQGRNESRILYLRNFNNWIKSELIIQYLNKVKLNQPSGSPLRVLDMCCGKGGDLFKWDKGGITHLICTDIAEVSIEHCKERYRDLLSRNPRYAHKQFTAEFFACDCTLVRLRGRYKDPSLKFNLVSCQFALHYSFESVSQADCMIRNAAECLLPGGYFIATIPNANEIIRRLRKNPNSSTFGNNIYKIEFISDTNPPSLFGAKYKFNLEGVVDCPEFLVHFPTLEKLCRRHGLQLYKNQTFEEYYKEKLETGRQLLLRMNGLELVYPNAVRNNPQYNHINDIYGSGNLRNPFHTLSKDEWEAANLYMVCAFKKCKNSWDANGKPIFEFDD